jgi:hypothetical protein
VLRVLGVRSMWAVGTAVHVVSDTPGERLSARLPGVKEKIRIFLTRFSSVWYRAGYGLKKVSSRREEV